MTMDTQHSSDRLEPAQPGSVAMIFVQAFNLPLEIAVIVGGIYRLIDTGSTTINVTGDMVGTTLVAHTEGWRMDQPFEDDEQSAEKANKERVAR
jgi:Na+/H+-dicarboxylate symporter